MDRQSLRKLRVLVADQAYMATLTAGMLRTLGIKLITEVNDSGAAVMALSRKSFDLMIIDDALGPTDPLQVTRDIRADEANASRHIPVLMTFTTAEKARVVAARDAGVTEFLIKPLSASVIGLRLTQTLANPRPFVAATVYVGPDRRRKTAMVTGPERRAKS